MNKSIYPTPAPNERRILVIDDDEGILEAVQCTLEMEGYVVYTSYSSKNLWSLKEMPDLILLDVLLSGEDGRDIARKLKRQTSTKNIPLIMMSAHPDSKTTTKEAGADAFLAKPFDIDELIQTIDSFIRN